MDVCLHIILWRNFNLFVPCVLNAHSHLYTAVSHPGNTEVNRMRHSPSYNDKNTYNNNNTITTWTLYWAPWVLYSTSSDPMNNCKTSLTLTYLLYIVGFRGQTPRLVTWSSLSRAPAPRWFRRLGNETCRAVLLVHYISRQVQYGGTRRRRQCASFSDNKWRFIGDLWTGRQRLSATSGEWFRTRGCT